METTIAWQDIEIKIEYVRSYSKSYEEIYGHPLAHLQIYTDEPLPITKTGYQSLFIVSSEIEERGGAIAFVETWLDSESVTPAWQAYLASRKQLSLF